MVEDKRMKHVAIALALMTGTAYAQQSADPVKSEYSAKLRNLRVTLDFKTAPLEDVINYLREIADMNLFVGSKVKEKGEIAITLRVADLTLKSVLKLMLEPHQLTYVYKEGVLYITTKEDADQDVVMEIYDVRDLLYPITDFPGVDMTLSADGLGATITEEPSTAAEMPIVDLVKAHTGGKTWDDNPKAAINLQNGLLVIKQTKECHAQVRRLIGKLRDFK
jgi:type II secretory pathway component GspD/PulD (secretin)